MSFQKYLMPLCIASGVAVSHNVATAQNASASPAFEPFTTFVAKLHSTTADQMTAPQSAAVKTTAAAEEMRQHLLGLYAGLSIDHSYELGGQIVDCVPIHQQPSVRQLGPKSIASPPSISPPSKARTAGVPQTSQRNVSGIDAFGHKQVCNSGSIPMRRITLQEMSRFPTLRDFFAKGPNGAGQVRPRDGNGSFAAPQIDGHHDYAHAAQYVNNYGGFTTLSLYSPFVDTNSGQVFSLSQQWYAGFSPTTQTAEIGIQNYPAKYGSENSALFIYWTADGYQQTGCYNLDCAAFVQINNNWVLGGAFPNYSTDPGAVIQFEVTLGYYFYGGNWWMYANGDWVGYYPGSIYNGGTLSQYAQVFDMGGETVGGASYPPMGSGEFADVGQLPGNQTAAYHRLIQYVDTAYNFQFAPSLTTSQPTPSCYSITSPGLDSTSGTFFFFGGPGSKNPSLAAC